MTVSTKAPRGKRGKHGVTLPAEPGATQPDKALDLLKPATIKLAVDWNKATDRHGTLTGTLCDTLMSAGIKAAHLASPFRDKRGLVPREGANNFHVAAYGEVTALLRASFGEAIAGKLNDPAVSGKAVMRTHNGKRQSKEDIARVIGSMRRDLQRAMQAREGNNGTKKATPWTKALGAALRKMVASEDAKMLRLAAAFADQVQAQFGLEARDALGFKLPAPGGK